MTLIDKNKQKIKQLCLKHKVQKLSAFGSVLTDQFTSTSDVDMLVTFDTKNINDYFTNFFDFKYSLEGLLGREIDLVEEDYIANPYFLNSINSNRLSIYG